jgi:3-isopropylmalate/(R)-2-methylmalate dehydratase small subunit
MEPFTTVSGVAAPLLRPNLDTDTIMPKQFLKGIDRSGLRDGFLFDLRFTADGTARPDFILNQPAWSDARFLVVGPNFGCGSSREHAVWGMQQFGIRALIGTTYGGIFRNNCARNGVLAISLAAEEVELLGSEVGKANGTRLSIDLAAQTVAVERTSQVIRFAIGALEKDALLQGLDGVSATLRDADKIRDFEKTYHLSCPWLDLQRCRQD